MQSITPGAIAIFLNGLGDGGGNSLCEAPIKSFDVFYTHISVLGFTAEGEEEACPLD